VGVNSPKATITIVPEESWNVPLIAFSFGKSFFTEDPRTGVGQGPARHYACPGSPVETARSYQLVASKTFNKTDVKLTLDMRRKPPSMARSTQTRDYRSISAGANSVPRVYAEAEHRAWIATGYFRASGCAPCGFADGVDHARGSETYRRSCRHVSKAALSFASESRV